MDNRKGYVIVIEGTDGCGKQTQTRALYEKLISKGYSVRVQSFPNYDSPSASPVKMYLGGEFGGEKDVDPYQASSLYAVDRLCTYLKDLKGFYEKGGIILFDRYVQSNMLHQAGKIGDREEVNKFLEWLDNLEFETLKLPRPNKVIYLDVPLEISQALAKARGSLKAGTAKDIHEADEGHMRRAYESGKYVREKYGWDVINCTENGQIKSIEDISDIIWSRVYPEIENLNSIEM